MAVTDIYDVIGAGFGPAGMALAAAMEDDVERGGSRLRSRFFERAQTSAWQAELLLPGTHIQHHYLRDFATPRNPRSRFTFTNYLYTHNRLFHFGQLEGHPPRAEWSAYCEWVAAQLSHYVAYSHEVLAVTPEPAAGTGNVILNVRTLRGSDGLEECWRTRNLVLATGRTPAIPPVFMPHLGPRVVHPSQFLTAVRAIPAGAQPTFAVVGSGESAIEVVLALAENFPASTIYSIHRGNGFRLYELGHFTNEAFFPEEVDYVYSLEKGARTRLFETEIRRTNYAAVGSDMSARLYRQVYEGHVLGRQRIHIRKRSTVSAMRPHGDGYELELRDTYCGQMSAISADLVFVCTGYREAPVPALLGSLKPYLCLDDDGDLIVSREYQVKTIPELHAGVFLCGLTERTHGVSDSTSFGMMALKGQRIMEALQMRLEHYDDRD